MVMASVGPPASNASHSHIAQASINKNIGTCFVKLDKEKAFWMHANYQTNKALRSFSQAKIAKKRSLDAYWAQVKVKFAGLMELEGAEDFGAC